MKNPQAICRVEAVNGWIEARTHLSFHMDQCIKSTVSATGRQKQEQQVTKTSDSQYIEHELART